MEKGSKKRFVVIDGKSVFYRGFYAMPYLKTVSGTPTGGVYGFALMSLEVIKRLKPDYVAIAWDKPKTNIRKRLEIYSGYKAGRKPAPPEFYEQIPILHKLLDSLGWPLYELDDYEADDIIGALANQASNQNIETIIITSDMDMLQVVHDDIKVYALKTGLSNIELYSPKTFEAKHHIKVSQYLDLKALKGDSSDNIPGVPGIGEKTAVDLLNQYKSLDGIYENIDLIKDAVRNKLVTGKDSAYMSKKLAEIWIDAPVKLNLDEIDGSNIKVDELIKLLEELQFNTLKNKVSELFPKYKTAVLENSSKFKVVHVKDLNELSWLEKYKDPIFIYGRSSDKFYQKPSVLMLGDEKTCYAIDLNKFDKEELTKKLGNIKNIIGFDTKSSIKILLNYTKSPKVIHDVLMGAFLLNSVQGEITLGSLANLGYEVNDLDNEELLSRSGEILGCIKDLYLRQIDEFKNFPEINKLAKNVEWPVISVLAEMEKTGIKLDVDYLSEFNKKIEQSIQSLEKNIFEIAGHEFNIASPQQLSEVLFSENELGLPTGGIKKTKKGYSTAANELDKVRLINPIINLISDYREVVKLKNTYVDTLPKQIDEESRVHTTFSLTTAQTGRLSSLDPNLQNIPTRTDLGRNIRTAFVPGPGNVFVSADYAQFELRLAAVFSEDKELIKLFNEDVDIYTVTASQIYGRNPEDITKQMRDAAKTINFGIIYGISPHGLSNSTGMSYEQSKAFIDKYKEIRKPLFDYMEKITEKTKELGYAETMFGRRRYFPDIKSSNFVVRQAAERAAINMPIQGTEADLMKMAMIECDKSLKELHNDCKILLQVHDSVLVECPKEVAKQVSSVIRESMENIYKLPLKLKVEVKIGNNWGEL